MLKIPFAKALDSIYNKIDITMNTLFMIDEIDKYIDYRIDIELSERLPNFDEEPVDISIGMSIPLTGNVIQKQIETNRGCFCASPAICCHIAVASLISVMLFLVAICSVRSFEPCVLIEPCSFF